LRIFQRWLRQLGRRRRNLFGGLLLLSWILKVLRGTRTLMLCCWWRSLRLRSRLTRSDTNRVRSFCSLRRECPSWRAQDNRGPQQNSCPSQIIGPLIQKSAQKRYSRAAFFFRNGARYTICRLTKQK